MRVMRLRPMEMGTLGPRRDWEEQILRFFGVDTLTMCDLIRCRIHRPRAGEVGREIGVRKGRGRDRGTKVKMRSPCGLRVTGCGLRVAGCGTVEVGQDALSLSCCPSLFSVAGAASRVP